MTSEIFKNQKLNYINEILKDYLEEKILEELVLGQKKSEKDLILYLVCFPDSYNKNFINLARLALSENKQRIQTVFETY